MRHKKKVVKTPKKEKKRHSDREPGHVIIGDHGNTKINKHLVSNVSMVMHSQGHVIPGEEVAMAIQQSTAVQEGASHTHWPTVELRGGCGLLERGQRSLVCFRWFIVRWWLRG